jgi:hypothetical protein
MRDKVHIPVALTPRARLFMAYFNELYTTDCICEAAHQYIYQARKITLIL